MMKLLHLDDEPLDLELTRAACQQLDPHCEIVTAANREQFVAGLQHADLSGILSDSQVHNLTGAEAAELAHARVPQVPFIFLCGSISDERRSQLEASGPHAIVSKNEPAKLAAVLQQLLDAQRARAGRDRGRKTQD